MQSLQKQIEARKKQLETLTQQHQAAAAELAAAQQQLAEATAYAKKAAKAVRLPALLLSPPLCRGVSVFSAPHFLPPYLLVFSVVAWCRPRA